MSQTILESQYGPDRVLVIPVVFHVIYQTDGEGYIPESLIRSQVDVLNEDFQALAGTMGAEGVDARIRFELATIDPWGQPTSGIEYWADDYWFRDPGLNSYNDMKSWLAWDTQRYLNIYTNDAGGGGTLGYATFPQLYSGSYKDGVVLLWTSVGRDAPSGGVYDQGRTGTHEVGHYLGLFHTFQDGCGIAYQPYTTGDLIADTAPQAIDSTGCPVGQISCSTYDPIHNYMDYSYDSCMTNFTPEQVNRMRCSLMNYRPNLYRVEAPPTCTYSLSEGSAVFGPNGGTNSFTVFAGSSCSWTATEISSWITITSGSSGTGNRSVSYRVSANTGPRRTGYISVAGQTHTVTQNAPTVTAGFDISNSSPKIGESVTFTADPILDIDYWDFGEAACNGQRTTTNCFWLPVGACNDVDWAFPTSGEKTVIMVLKDGRTVSNPLTVQATGECCLADGAPSASFTGPSEANVGDRVTFSDTSSKSVTATKALGFTSTPEDPEIGEQLTFTLTGLTGSVAKATWQFGETGCSGEPAIKECNSSLFNNCTGMTFTYASSGAKSVTVSVDLEGGGTASAGPVAINVSSSGSCDGGTGGCSYSISPIQRGFGVAGGHGTFAVATVAECAWEATTTSSWIEITNGAGTGSGTVSYSVAQNPSDGRTGYVQLEGRTHTVSQDPSVVETDRDPTAWQWSARVINEDDSFGDEVATGTNPTFSHVFKESGRYLVSLVASNCAGSTESAKTLTVTDLPIEDFVVGAAVSLAGANETHWETDLRFFNPCGVPLDVHVGFEPEGTNNTDVPLLFREFHLTAGETRVFADIVEAIPSLEGEELSGSVLIESNSAIGCRVMAVSKTFNDTLNGSLGLFVPALPVKRNTAEFLDLTGLVSDSAYRTNLRLVNYGDVDAWVPLTLYGRNGNVVGDGRSAMVRGHSTNQINDIAEWLGVTGPISPFSVRAGVSGIDVQAFATVVDNTTGDSVLFISSFTGANQSWLVGVANLEGVNNSQWQTDVWLYNPTGDWLGGEVEFVVGDSPNDVYGFQFPTLKTHRVKRYLDVVGEELGLQETRGYLVVTGENGGPAPQVAARTYNVGIDGGTYGLNLSAFGEDDLLRPGDVGYVFGFSNSADQNAGFRTNLGLLNTDRDKWTIVRLTLLDVTGASIGEPLDLVIAPGVLRQFDVAKKFGVGDVTGTASLKIEVTEGGGVAAYATEIDNRTQDSIFIRAMRATHGSK